MNKAELLAHLAGMPGVVTVMAAQLQAKDTAKIEAGVNPYLVPFMYSQGGASQGENVLMYVYDEGDAGEFAEFDNRSFARVFGGAVYEGDLADVRARAVEIIGGADELRAQAALDVMVTDTTSLQLTENRESEDAIMSRLGMDTADGILSKIEAYLTAAGKQRVVRLIQSARGVNLADPETIRVVEGMVVGGVLNQSEADLLLASNTVTSPRWPNLQLWQVVEALRA